MVEIGLKMRELVQTYGLEILCDEKKLNGLLADLFPKEGKMRNAIREALKTGAGNMFYELAKSTGNDVSEKLAVVHKKLVDEAWLSDAAADSVCRIFLTSVGKDIKLSEVQNGMPDPGQLKELSVRYTEIECRMAEIERSLKEELIMRKEAQLNHEIQMDELKARLAEMEQAFKESDKRYTGTKHKIKAVDLHYVPPIRERYKCSLCGRIVLENVGDFCPSCGGDMLSIG